VKVWTIELIFKAENFTANLIFKVESLFLSKFQLSYYFEEHLTLAIHQFFSNQVGALKLFVPRNL